MITHKQMNCLKVIRRLAARGTSPSYLEIARELGTRHKSEVWQFIQQLSLRGYIEQAPRAYRSPRQLILTDKAHAVLPPSDYFRFDPETQTLQPMVAV